MKTALVTGGNKGIGYEICHQLGRLGFHVILAARNREKGLAAVQQLNRLSISIVFLQLDVTSIESIHKGFIETREKTSKLDVLINNAAILFKNDVDLLSVPESTINETIHTNVLGPLRIVQAFSPLLIPGSRVINISSGGGSMTDEPGGWSPVYCISKAALNALTKQLACSLYQRGVIVNCMDPGWVRTDMGGEGANRSVQKGAETAVWLSTALYIPNGKFIRDKKIIPW